MRLLGNSPHKTAFGSELATSGRREAARELHGLRQHVCHPQLICHRRRLQAARARARGIDVENPAVLLDAENPGGPAKAHRPRTRSSFLATGTFGSPAPPPLRLRVLGVEEQADPAESLRGGVLGSVVPPPPGVAPSGCFHFRLLDAPQGTSDGKPQPYEDQMGP
ncbi:hypothetical protein H8959_006964 [Pygathrix nigripes]